MKNTLSVLLLFCIFWGCTNPKPKTVVVDSVKKQTKVITQISTFKPYNLAEGYLVIDTGSYGNEGPMGGGRYGIIKHDTQTDTIDLGYGLTKLGDKSYLCQTLIDAQSDDMKNSKGSLVLDVNHYVIIKDEKKIKLENIIHNFDNYFSSPSAIKGKIYFWQLNRADTTQGKMPISAAQFDPSTNKIVSHFLFKDGVETDDSGYFPCPYLENDRVIFYLSDKSKWSYPLSFN